MMLLLVHAAATFTMLGVILVVQLVHYPLFRHVGPASYESYQAEHMRRITWIVAPAMTTEFVTAGLLAWHPPGGVPVDEDLGGRSWEGAGQEKCEAKSDAGERES